MEVERLSVDLPTRHGTWRALDEVSLSIAPGEILGIVGESGAGKSMLAAATIGLLPPPARISGGAIRFDGTRIDDIGEAAMRRVRGRRIGAIFQDPLTSLNPLFTIGRQLRETIQLHLGLSDAAARARAVEWLQEVGIAGAAGRLSAYPHEFSGGMRQRVVIAMALCGEPQLVIADEPTTALDVSVQAQIIALLRRLAGEHGTAFMLVTHDMGVIAEAADRAAVLYAGRVMEVGPAASVLHCPGHPYTEGLMASIPTLDAERAEGLGGRLRPIEGAMPRPSAIPPGCPFHPRCPYAFARCRAEPPALLAAGGTLAACWLHAPAGPAHE